MKSDNLTTRTVDELRERLREIRAEIAPYEQRRVDAQLSPNDFYVTAHFDLLCKEIAVQATLDLILKERKR